MGDLGSIPGFGRSPGEGIFQDSGLENSMDGTGHGVTKSRTQLSDFHFILFVRQDFHYAYASSEPFGQGIFAGNSFMSLSFC